MKRLPGDGCPVTTGRERSGGHLRIVSYLGLLPPPIGGRSEVTRLYRAKFGEPRPGQKVFIVTCQEHEGWKGLDLETSATVPERPTGGQELQGLNGLHGLHGVNVSPSGVPQTSEPGNGHIPYMHTGCTPDAQGIAAPVVSHWEASGELGDGVGDAPGTPLEGRKVPEEEGDAPV